MKIQTNRIPKYSPLDYQYQKEATIPVSWDNPDVPFTMPRDQGSRGTCVGHAAAQVKDLLYLKLNPQDRPDDADWQLYKKDQRNGIGALFDEAIPQACSAEMIYQMSRKQDPHPPKTGSDIAYAVRALKEYGVCSEHTWHTTKSDRNVYTIPPGGALTEGKEHVIDGYASVSDINSIKSAVFSKGAVIAAIKLTSAWQTVIRDGIIKDGNPTSQAHAIAITGYDENSLHITHTLPGTPRAGSISIPYWNKYKISAYTILDTIEVEYLKKIFHTIQISSNTIADITIDGEKIGKTPCKASLEADKKYTITAVSFGQELTQTVTGGDLECKFTFPTKSATFRSIVPKKVDLSHLWEKKQ